MEEEIRGALFKSNPAEDGDPVRPEEREERRKAASIPMEQPWAQSEQVCDCHRAMGLGGALVSRQAGHP